MRDWLCKRVPVKRTKSSRMTEGTAGNSLLMTFSIIFFMILVISGHGKSSVNVKLDSKLEVIMLDFYSKTIF